MSVPAKPLALPVEKNKKWQMELLMERLRNKASQQKTFPELSKSTRMTLLEKRYALDVVEKENLQKCLDSMQHCIKVTTKQGLVERLESLSRQLGLKYNMEENSSLFISSDMFYLEILLEANGCVQDVKVHHECKSLQSCSVLQQTLAKGDFIDFTAHLLGFASIYQLNAEPKIKSKAYMALQALELDVFNMFQLNNYFTDVKAQVLQSPTGLVQKRRGGHSMKLTYFLSPLELLDLQTKSIATVTPEFVHSKRVGHSVTINLEASVAHKLQIQPILNLSDPQNITCDPMTTYNSTMLPASFVLTLNKPMPICQSLIKRMIRVTDLPFGSAANSGASAGLSATTAKEPPKVHPIMGLIGSSNGLVTNINKGLVVSLPDQCHCYFMTDNRELAGENISSIPFTLPSQVFELVQLLRQQAIFNSLLGSCVRPNSKPDLLDSMTVFEVTALSTQQINVALEHPFDDSMITVEFDLTHVASLQCKIFPSSPVHEQLSVKLSRVAQTCMSIPVTLRALIKAFEQANRESNLSGAFSSDTGSSGIIGPDTSSAGGGGDGNGKSGGAPPGIANNNGSGLAEGGGGGGGTASNNANHLMATTSTPATGIGLFDSSSYNVFDPGATNQSQIITSAAGAGDLDEGMAIKKRRVTGEDFWRSPKRTNNKLATEEDEQQQAIPRPGANEDSNSLGGGGNSDGMESNNNNNNSNSSRQNNSEGESAERKRKMNTQLSLVNGAMMAEEETVQEHSRMEIEDEDDDLGNILNEIKNNKDLNDLFTRATAEGEKKQQQQQQTVEENDDDEDDDAEADDLSSGGATSPGEERKKFNSIEEQLARMGTPYVSITPIPAINSSPAGSNTTTTSTKTIHHHHQEPSTANSSVVAAVSSSQSSSSSSSMTNTTMTTTKTNTSSSASAASLRNTCSSSSSSEAAAAAANIKSVLSDMGITTDKRLAIEIIPLSPSVVAAAVNPQQQPAKSTASVTITPIDLVGVGKSSSHNSSSSSSRSLKKSSSSSSLSEEQERARIKKRRMDEYSEKVRKSQSSSSGGSSRPASSASPKYATSPKPNSIFNSSSGRGSPKQSGSPKGDSRSPYSHSSQSPSSSSGSGKPTCMSTLKSATVIGSPKGEKNSQKGGTSSLIGGSSSGSSSRDRDREREKKSSGSPKTKQSSSSSVRLKSIDLNVNSQDELSQDGMRGLAASLFRSGSTAGASGKAKNSLSAVIDKLKSAQGPEGDLILKAMEKQSRMGLSTTTAASGNSSNVGGRSGGEGQSGSYIIKPSSDGMKLTINKTKSGSKSSSSSSLSRSQSSSSLKIGSTKKYGSPNSYSSTSGVSSSSKSKLPFQKSSSSGSLTSSSTSPALASAATAASSSSSSGYKSSSSSLKTISGSGGGDSTKSNSEKKSSKSAVPDVLTKATTPQDVLKLLGLPSSNSMDGFMKSLDKKFQIPKLSARSSSTDQDAKRSSAPTTPTGLAPTDPKLLTDFLTKEVPLKYPFPLNLNANYSALGHRSSPVTIEKVVNSNSNSNSGDGVASLTTAIDGEAMRPPAVAALLNSCSVGDSDATAPPVDGKVKSVHDPLATKFHPTPSPSVSLHIVKSPVPSPKTIANSPCIDDELMDEALVGISGK